MNTPDSSDIHHSNISEDLLPKLHSQTRGVLDGVEALLANGIEDANDRTIVSAAMAFIEHPTEHLPDIILHTGNIGMVLVGYDMQGADIPPEIDAMNAYLLTLQCINRIKFIEGWHDKSTTSSPDTQQIPRQTIDLTMEFALSEAAVLSRQYKDNTLNDALNELKDRIA